MSSTKCSIDKYRFVASCIMQTFLDNTLDESKNDIEETMKQNHLSLIKNVIDPIMPDPTWKRYLHGIVQSVIGAFVFMFILCGLIFFLNLSDNQYTFTFGGKGDAKIEQIETKQASTCQHPTNDIDISNQ